MEQISRRDLMAAMAFEVVLPIYTDGKSVGVGEAVNLSVEIADALIARLDGEGKP